MDNCNRFGRWNEKVEGILDFLRNMLLSDHYGV